MSNMISVNFEGVESGGGFAKIPEGDYVFKIVKHKQGTGTDSGKPYILFSLKAIKGPKKGINKTIAHNCSLQKNALWNLRNMLEAAGKNIPSKAIKLDLDKLIGLEVGGTAVDGEYEGKAKSEISTFFPPSEWVEDTEISKKTDKLEESSTEDETEEATPEDEPEETDDEELV